MKNIQIITDSSADLSKELVEKYGIEVVPFYVSFSEETYLKEGEEISQKNLQERQHVFYVQMELRHMYLTH